MKAVATVRTLKEVGDRARDWQAREQAELIDWMCLKTGLSVSALAAAAGRSNVTITRPRQQGRPVKIEFMERMAYACSKIISAASLRHSQ
jgi:hypothetical protein